jgi:hypothetical protein
MRPVPSPSALLSATALAALLASAACATRDNPVTCTSADECESGLACDLSANACVPATVFFAADGFDVDGDTWWSATGGPVIRGTVDDPNATQLRLFVGDVPLGPPAVIDGASWSVALPVGSLPTGTTVVAARLAGAAGTVETSQRFGVDGEGPRLEVTAASGARDERSDVVDVASGEPVHDHVGPMIAIDGSCPDLFVHGYLTGDDPDYGREHRDNPVTLWLALEDRYLDRTSLRYRVATAAGLELRGWTAAAVVGEASSGGAASAVIALRADGDAAVPWLRTGDDEVHVELEVADLGGHRTQATACFRYHALPAPLEVGALAALDDPRSIAGWRLRDDAPVQRLVKADGDGGDVGAVAITQYTTEPVTLRLDLEATALAYQVTRVSDVVTRGDADAVVCERCVSGDCVPVPAPDPACAEAVPASGAVTSLDDQLAAPPWQLKLVELIDGARVPVGAGCEASGAALTCEVPAREVGKAPRQFLALLRLLPIAELAPPGAGALGSYALFGLHYVGRAPSWRDGCDEFAVEAVAGVPNLTLRKCLRPVQYTRVVALDQVRLTTVGAATLWPSVSQGVDGLPLAPLGAPAPSAIALDWDSGDDDLPGMH